MSFTIEHQEPLVPAAIEFLIHCYCMPAPFPRQDSGFHKSLTEKWLREGVIEEHAATRNYCKTTDLGRAWVIALCNVKKPIVAYVDEHGAILT